MGPAGTPSEGDLAVDVAAVGRAAAFAGRDATVWIERDEWAGFLDELRALEGTRRGEAHVTAMGPEEFRLAVFATDPAGHMAAEGWVGREYVGRTGVLRDRVCFTVVIDPSTLPQLVRQFETLAAVG